MAYKMENQSGFNIFIENNLPPKDNKNANSQCPKQKKIPMLKKLILKFLKIKKIT